MNVSTAALIVSALAVAATPPANAADPAPPLRASAIGLQLGPDTTVITAPLNASGYPDYAAALDAELSAQVSRDENFWVPMWQAIGNGERSSDEFLSELERKLGISIPREPRQIGRAHV